MSRYDRLRQFFSRGRSDAQQIEQPPVRLGFFARLRLLFQRRQNLPLSQPQPESRPEPLRDNQLVVALPAEEGQPPQSDTVEKKQQEFQADNKLAGEQSLPPGTMESLPPLEAVPFQNKEPEMKTELSPAQPSPAEQIAPEATPVTSQPPAPEVIEPGKPVATEVLAPVEPKPVPAKDNRFGRIREALSRTGKGFERAFLGRKHIDDDLLEDLETQLLSADLGMEVTTEVINNLTARVKRKELSDVATLQATLKALLVEILQPCEQPLVIEGAKPYVVLMVGINGVGKTTTIGKLAKQFLNQGRTVMLAAGDTFRAAAVEQLQVWGERNGVAVVAQHTGADSASVIFDAVESATAKGVDVLLADTAGRLHTKNNLMEELKKIKRVMAKLDPATPQEVLLVLDAGTGQNAVNQLQQFHEAVGVTGIVLTKLDGTAKGGVIFALCRRFGIPVRYIGVGEGLDDLQPFKAVDFVNAMLAPADSSSATVN